MSAKQQLVDKLREAFPGMVDTAMGNLLGGGSTKVSKVVANSFERFGSKSQEQLVQEVLKRSSGKNTPMEGPLAGLKESMQKAIQTKLQKALMQKADLANTGAKYEAAAVKARAESSASRATSARNAKELAGSEKALLDATNKIAARNKTSKGLSNVQATAAIVTGTAALSALSALAYKIGEFPPASEDYADVGSPAVGQVAAEALASSKGIPLDKAPDLLSDPTYGDSRELTVAKDAAKKAPTTEQHNQSFIKDLKAVAKAFPSITDHVQESNGRLKVVSDDRLNQSIYASVQENGNIAFTNLQPNGKLLEAPRVQAFGDSKLAPSGGQSNSPESRLSDISRARQDMTQYQVIRADFIRDKTSQLLEANENYTGIRDNGIANANDWLAQHPDDAAATKDLAAMHNEVAQYKLQAEANATRSANADTDLITMDRNTKFALEDAKTKVDDTRSGRAAGVNFLIATGQSEEQANANFAIAGPIIKGLVGRIGVQNGKPLRGDVYLSDTSWQMNQLYARGKAKDKLLAAKQLGIMSSVRDKVLADMGTLEYRTERSEATGGVSGAEAIGVDNAIQYKARFNALIKSELMASTLGTSMNIDTIRARVNASESTVEQEIAKLKEGMLEVDNTLAKSDIPFEYGVDAIALNLDVANLISRLENPPLTFFKGVGDVLAKQQIGLEFDTGVR